MLLKKSENNKQKNDMRKYSLPELILNAADLEKGTQILLSGTIYTARDAAHQRIISMLDNNKKPPFILKDSAIYYCGPSPARPGQIIGACGPTTSSRMDSFTVRLLEEGVKILIGKGKRADYIMEALKKHRAYYLIAAGGIAALLSKTVKKAQIIGFKDLGAEAIYKLEVEDMPLIIS